MKEERVSDKGQKKVNLGNGFQKKDYCKEKNVLLDNKFTIKVSSKTSIIC